MKGESTKFPVQEIRWSSSINICIGGSWSLNYRGDGYKRYNEFQGESWATFDRTLPWLLCHNQKKAAEKPHSYRKLQSRQHFASWAATVALLCFQLGGTQKPQPLLLVLIPNHPELLLYDLWSAVPVFLLCKIWMFQVLKEKGTIERGPLEMYLNRSLSPFADFSSRQILSCQIHCSGGREVSHQAPRGPSCSCSIAIRTPIRGNISYPD